MVEIQYFVALEAVYDLQLAYYVAQGVLGSLVHQLVLAFGHTAAGIVAEAPLLADDSAFVVQCLLLAGDVAGPVVQHHKHGIHERIPHQRHFREVIDGLGPGGEGIHVITETHAFLGQEIEYPLAGIMPGAVEGHMLQEMGQTVLIVLFLESAHIVRDIELRAALGLLVMAEIVAQPVVEPAGAEIGVVRYGLGKYKVGCT